jgi:molybdenum cofactor synthesis domain-containing protein
MPPAMPSASKEIVTAALLVVGGKILSGRTKDQNIGYVAEYLTAVGIDLEEVRVVGDEEGAIVDALNALRHRYSYVFTTGGIGPTHGDITADCVAKAFGVTIDSDPRALAILHEWVETTGAEMNEARLRMTRIPKGADLILNKVSGAPGFWIGNVIVLAGVPSIMQAMLDEVAPKLKIRIRILSETVRAGAREGDIGMQLGEIAKANPEVAIGSYPFFDPQHGPNTNVVLSSRRPNARSRRCWSECGEHNRIAEPRPLTGENRGSSPLGSANDFKDLASEYPSSSNTCPTNVSGQRCTGSTYRGWGSIEWHPRLLGDPHIIPRSC